MICNAIVLFADALRGRMDRRGVAASLIRLIPRKSQNAELLLYNPCSRTRMLTFFPCTPIFDGNVLACQSFINVPRSLNSCISLLKVFFASILFSIDVKTQYQTTNQPGYIYRLVARFTIAHAETSNAPLEPGCQMLKAQL